MQTQTPIYTHTHMLTRARIFRQLLQPNISWEP